jgi:SAM-dependent methyltransferase
MLDQSTLLQPRIHRFDYLGLTFAHDKVCRLLERELGERRVTVLDIGCGSGAWKPVLTPYAAEYVGLELEDGEHVDVVGSAEQMPLEDDRFDLVFAQAVLEHVRDYPAAVAEMHRVLKPGGLALVGTHGTWEIHGAPHDYWRWTPYGFEQTFRAFASCRVEQVGGPVMNYFAIRNLYWRRLQLRCYPLRWLFTPFVLLNNLIGRSIGAASEAPATLPVFYYVLARK